MHRRHRPEPHAFRYPLSHVWLDPDDPDALCGEHPLWSARRPAPARFRRADYGATPSGPLGAAARSELTPVLGHRPTGDVRLLTQVRRFGWLFNPISVFVVWHTDPDAPAGAVLEVTNTPWHERHRYPVALTRPDAAGWMRAEFDKRLHVSPFLDEDLRYDLRLRGSDDGIELGLDVVAPADGVPILETALVLDRRPATRATLGAGMRSNPFPTHRVSAGIHAQALRLWRKRVPFVAHPRKRQATTS